MGAAAWRADLTVPLRYAPVDDTKFYLMLVKGIVEHGWYLSNSHLGAPFGQQLSDYPQGADNLNLALVRCLALFTSNPALIVNLFFLLTFALVSFVAHLVLRSLGLSAIAAGGALGALRAARLPLLSRRVPPAAVGVLRGAAGGLPVPRPAR